ncbi:hypothetical protein FQY83_13455 [Luteimonas marina]|uniref:OsmC family protein n=1 Tax=Luteimonas marina TaxID=488485 RepID=A0A5C5U1F2_9GAMM|nr:hypothetical protein [Luteimonas marina]TWT19355.1 hypothetical protein FQY83_13455 [Luteimonas marina]
MSIDAPIRITLEQDGDYACRIRFDCTELEPLPSDEPSPLGADRGPDPARLLLPSVANCLVASLLFALRKQRNGHGFPLETRFHQALFSMRQGTTVLVARAHRHHRHRVWPRRCAHGTLAQ